jgi:hypothetical protein
MILVLLAAVIAAEPIVHTHPLASHAGESNGTANPSVCAVCAVGAARILVVAPTIAAPTVVVMAVTSRAVATHSGETPLSLTSRAPPAA